MRVSTTAFISTVAAAVTLTGLAQTRAPAPPPPNSRIVTAEAPREPSAANNKTAEDIEFLVEARRSSLAEARLGQLAMQQSQDQRVRELGAKIATDHASLAAEIERLLEPLQVTIPTEPAAQAQTDHAAVARLSGREFDVAFIEMMIGSHTEAIEEYGAQTHANPDRALADFASRSLPVLRAHLASAQALGR